jgi:hypothetical protein
MVTGVGTRVRQQHNFFKMGLGGQRLAVGSALFIVCCHLFPSATGFVAASMAGGSRRRMQRDGARRAATDSQGVGSIYDAVSKGRGPPFRAVRHLRRVLAAPLLRHETAEIGLVVA